MRKIILSLAAIFFVVSIPARAAEPLSVNISTESKEITGQESFPLKVQIKNEGKNETRFSFYSCDKMHPWNFEPEGFSVVSSQYRIRCEGMAPPDEIVLPAGAAYEETLDVAAGDEAKTGPVSLKLGFTLGRETIHPSETIWSNSVEITVGKKSRSAAVSTEIKTSAGSPKEIGPEHEDGAESKNEESPVR